MIYLYLMHLFFIPSASPLPGYVVTGDRSGHVALWDLEGGTCSRLDRGAHAGHVTAAAWPLSSTPAGDYHSDDDSIPNGPLVYYTGGQDGRLKVWDARAAAPQADLPLHVTAQGRGAVGFIQPLPCAEHLLATAGADGSVHVLDMRAVGTGEGEATGVVKTARMTDFPYELKAVGPYVLVGCGDGSIHVIDATAPDESGGWDDGRGSGGAALYALGATRAAVRYMAAGERTLLAAGDDGTAILYRF
jgi:WD40 repeat protein